MNCWNVWGLSLIKTWVWITEIFCSINMAFKVSRGGCVFLGHVLPGVKANCYFKLMFKDAEILEIDPIQFLPFSWMVENLLLQPKHEDPFESEIYKICIQIWTFFERCLGRASGTCGLNHSVLVFADCLQHGSSHSSLHIWHCGPSYQRDSIAHHLPHCIRCGDSWAFCSLVQCHLAAIWPCSIWPGLSLKTWTNVKVNRRSSKRCGGIQSWWGVMLSHCRSKKEVFTDAVWSPMVGK